MYRELKFVENYNIWRALPDRTGTLHGHLIPATFFVIFSTTMLIMNLVRARNLRPGESFSAKHIPEKNPVVLKRISLSLTGAISIGLLYEFLTIILRPGYHFLTHVTMYTNYWLVGIMGYLESQGRLPQDSLRRALALAMTCNFVMMHGHGQMKGTPADQVFHVLLSNLDLVNAGVLAYSVKFPESVEAHIISFALLLLHGTWFITIGFYSCCVDVSSMEVPTYLCLQFVAIMVVIAAAAAFFVPNHNGNVAASNGITAPLYSSPRLSKHERKSSNEFFPLSQHDDNNNNHDNDLTLFESSDFA